MDVLEGIKVHFVKLCELFDIQQTYLNQTLPNLNADMKDVLTVDNAHAADDAVGVIHVMTEPWRSNRETHSITQDEQGES